MRLCSLHRLSFVAGRALVSIPIKDPGIEYEPAPTSASTALFSAALIRGTTNGRTTNEEIEKTTNTIELRRVEEGEKENLTGSQPGK